MSAKSDGRSIDNAQGLAHVSGRLRTNLRARVYAGASISPRSSFDGHDLAMDSFGYTVGNPMRAKRHDVSYSLLDGSGKFLHRLQFGLTNWGMNSEVWNSTA